MSRQSLLPPRCPFQKHVISRPIHDSYPQHRFPSQGSILEEKPAWLDDLLSDEDADSKGKCLRRSASDSITLLDGIVDSFSGLSPYNDEAASGGNETCSGLESASIYGPNSPRRKENVTFSKNAIASALSEYAFQNPLQYVDGSISGIKPLDQMGNACSSAGELNGETNTVKRHSGQRSRVRKLQYISELERTVNVLQFCASSKCNSWVCSHPRYSICNAHKSCADGKKNLCMTSESHLAVKVASMLQKRAALSLENNTLKQQVARIRQEKLMVEAQHKALKKEAERLKNNLGFTNNKFRNYIPDQVPPPKAARSEVTWQMAKLNLY